MSAQILEQREEIQELVHVDPPQLLQELYDAAQAEEVAHEVVVVCDLLFALEQVPVHPLFPHVLPVHEVAHVDIHALLHDAEQVVVHAVEQLFPQVLLHEFIQPPVQVVIQVVEQLLPQEEEQLFPHDIVHPEPVHELVQLLPQEEEQLDEQDDVHDVPHEPTQLPSVHPVVQAL